MDTCDQHQGLAISCSRIADMHEMMKTIDVKIDQFADKMDAAIAKAFEMDTRISVIETQKKERWMVQKWWNITLAGGIVSIVGALAYEWINFHGGA